ncbi:MAG: hypothetical protein ACK4OH_03175 [Acidovorax temperans]|uniref:hypothetical protein n=1 Tax=Acidovorax temperans TaxID=80878 RepID=UPI0039190C9E
MSVGSVPLSVDADAHDVVHRAWRVVLEELVERTIGNGTVQQAPHAHVVHNAAIHKVDVGSFRRVAVALGNHVQQACRQVVFDGRLVKRQVWRMGLLLDLYQVDPSPLLADIRKLLPVLLPDGTQTLQTILQA